jgi:hypothetical protein
MGHAGFLAVVPTASAALVGHQRRTGTPIALNYKKIAGDCRSLAQREREDSRYLDI